MRFLVALALVGAAAAFVIPHEDNRQKRSPTDVAPTGVDVKPWKKNEPNLRQIKADKEQQKIGGSAGIRRDTRSAEFDVAKDKIGGQAGIRPKDQKIGGQAGIRPREEEKKFDVAKDKIGGAAGIRRDTRDAEFNVAEDKIGGKAGIRPDNQPVTDVKPWKKDQPKALSGKVN
ncbi:unnamed protein product, partial [Mesorhabditis spiculigera]